MAAGITELQPAKAYPSLEGLAGTMTEVKIWWLYEISR